ncbi:unnamed protein product [Darwinula stevensoni]|uniref:Uncharacterized protein n=1 Tax=Darwinula stevensoni TaxID=69355 RepID=A0A7R9A8M3_9CRUS|nr:unnamed protein product [Darwinula stevensoni]CAG0896584.1 unnamed protein product [Darwinula stevensoni]
MSLQFSSISEITHARDFLDIVGIEEPQNLLCPLEPCAMPSMRMRISSCSVAVEVLLGSGLRDRTGCTEHGARWICGYESVPELDPMTPRVSTAEGGRNHGKSHVTRSVCLFMGQGKGGQALINGNSLEDDSDRAVENPDEGLTFGRSAVPNVENKPLTKLYKRRWYLLLLYAIYSCWQAGVYNTWGPLEDSVKAAYPNTWRDSTVALQVDWGVITYIIGFVPICWLAISYGVVVNLNQLGIALSFFWGNWLVPVRKNHHFSSKFINLWMKEDEAVSSAIVPSDPDLHERDVIQHFMLLRMLFGSVILATSLNYAAYPLTLELAAEVLYPSDENAVGGWLTAALNLFGFLFFTAFFIPKIGVLWINYTQLGTLLISLPLLYYFKADLRRSQEDESLQSQSVTRAAS